MNIRLELEQLAEPAYQKFSSRLTPNEEILGVRLPLLRKLAKRIAKEEGMSFFSSSIGPTMEETLLYGMVIGYVSCDVDTRLDLIRDFIPHIHSWAVCDSFCSTLKFTKTNKEVVWDFLQPYLHSSSEFSIRFGCVMILNYFKEESDLEKDVLILDSLSNKPYYAMMAVAWALSILYIYHPEYISDYLKQSHLDDKTYAKTIQKILESRKIVGKQREQVKALKRV